MDESRKLILKIARCQNFLQENPECLPILEHQRNKDLKERQIPEPWNGDIVNAKVLFVSSNPSIDEDEFFPTLSWKDDDIVNFFTNRFSPEFGFVSEDLRVKLKNGKYVNRPVKFWVFVRKEAAKLLNKDQQEIDLRKDVCIMEIVRCKSKGQKGLRASVIKTCSEKWLEETLKLAGASVIVVVGKVATNVFNNMFNLNLSFGGYEIKNICGKKRFLISVIHPSAMKKGAGLISNEVVDKFREFSSE